MCQIKERKEGRKEGRKEEKKEGRKEVMISFIPKFENELRCS